MTRQRAAISLLVSEIVLAACTAAPVSIAEPSARPAPEPRPVGVAAEPDAAARPVPQPASTSSVPIPTPMPTPTREADVAACGEDVAEIALHLADALAKRREVWEKITATDELMLYFGLAAVIIVEGTWAEENLTAEHRAWPPIAAYAERVAIEAAAWEEILYGDELIDELAPVAMGAFSDTGRLETELRLLAHGCR